MRMHVVRSPYHPIDVQNTDGGHVSFILVLMDRFGRCQVVVIAMTISKYTSERPIPMGTGKENGAKLYFRLLRRDVISGRRRY